MPVGSADRRGCVITAVMVGSFSRGVGDARRGALFLASRRRLWKLLVAPFLLAALLIAIVIWAGFSWLAPLVDQVLGFLPAWLSGLVAVTKILLLLLFFVGAYFVYASLAMVILAPFCELISEAIEAELLGLEDAPFSLGTFLRDLVAGAIHAARRLIGHLLTIAALLAVGALIPIVGPLLATALGAIATARAAAYDAYEAVWARKGVPYRQKMEELATYRGRSYGLGAAVAALLAVPIANLVAMPIGAAGATLAWVERAGQAPEGS